MEHHELLLIAGVMTLGMICQWIAWRAKIPAILPLLAAGFLVGPVFNLVHPQEELDNWFFPIVSLSVAIILFEGALTLTWREVRSVASTVRNLLTVGSLITWFGGAISAHYFMGLSWELSLLFGALIIVTGPTVIAPLLRNVRPTEKIASILKWEGILIDPIGATVAVLMFEFIVAGSGATFGAGIRTLSGIIGIGVALGLLGGLTIYLLLRRYLIPDYLRDVSTLAVVVLVFSLSNAAAEESGLLAVTVMGVFLANTDLRQLREIWYFKEKLSVLLISSLFILLAANVTMGDLMRLDWRSLVVLAVILFILRPVGMSISALGSGLSTKELLFLSWIAPRGIVAAAVSSLFAFELVQLGNEEAAILGPLTFLIIVGTVVIQGSTAKLIARQLGVSEAEPQGFLIMGANRLAQEIGLALQEANFVVRLIDANHVRVRKAKLRGLNATQGNLLSEYLETHIDISGIGRLLALTNNDEANALACKHYEDEFGSSEVYQLPPDLSERQRANPNRYQLGRLLFAPGATYNRLNELITAGAVLKQTALTEHFTLTDFRAEYQSSTIMPLMGIRRKQVLVATVEDPLEVGPGWTILSLVLEPEKPIQPVSQDALDAPPMPA